jgi:trehalose-6-phosphate synthase
LKFFLEKYPEFKKKVVLVQIATPSRNKIEEYCDMKKEIDEAVGSINGRFGSEEWTPVMYFYRKIPQQLLLAYYKAADVGLLTPIRDGMNLIAKEFAASKDEDGVLILSEFAGAAEELNEAIMVNPYDIQATAEAIKTAVEIPAEEKRQRFQAMKEKVKEHDSGWWLKNFLEEWERIYA